MSLKNMLKKFSDWLWYFLVIDIIIMLDWDVEELEMF